nr:unnamed protein product [Callosobruchus analis]
MTATAHVNFSAMMINFQK